MAELIIDPDAEAEYEDALAYCAVRSKKAAAGFEAAFGQALALIAATPERFALYDERHRFCTLRRYPYSVIYRIHSGKVRVLAVAHSGRSPGYWLARD